MNIYGNYKSPLGYQSGENYIDSYGVDHSGFSTRDEIEYQMARLAKENQIMQNFNKLGITKNYPQYGTNFWGNSDNNYGFGNSQISSNIENMQKSFSADNFDITGRTNLNNTQNINGNTLGNIVNNTLTETKGYHSPSNMMGLNNYYNPIEQALQLDIASVLSPKPLGNDANSYQIAQNTTPNTVSDVASTQPSYNTLPEYQLGMLSAKGETDNGKNLFNNCEADKTGGCSYGTYQIATGPGTMKDYLNYMKNKEEYKDFYNTLQQAGGFDAAKQGDDTFKSAWKNLSQNSEFLDSQHNFVLKNNYNTTINGINDIKGLNLDSRSPVIKDAIFSVSVQFGGKGGANLIHKALGNDASNLSDEDIINKIYDERGYKKYFKNSSENMQNSIKKNRSIDERQRALELLLKYPN